MTTTKAAGTKVGRYFTASEFGVTDASMLPGLGALCAVFLDPLRAQYGPCTVHSGHRSDKRNAEVGGAKESHHLYHERPLEPAADVSFARGTPNEWAKAARAIAGAVGRGGVSGYARHLHVDLGPRRVW